MLGSLRDQIGRLLTVAALLVALAALVLAPPASADSVPNDPPHRYLVLLGGINSHANSGESGDEVFDSFAGVQTAIRQNILGLSKVIYFSYSAAAKPSTAEPYCAGWRDACSATGQLGDLSPLDVPPVYSSSDTHQSIDAQTVVLRWLLEEVIKADPLAEIDLVGYSLGGVVAIRYAADRGNEVGIGEHVHAITVLESPVGGIPSAAGALAPGLEGLFWKNMLKSMFGETILVELQMPSDDPAASIVGTLHSATYAFDVTAVESTDDYMVNGQALPVCNPFCSEPELVLVGRGTQDWLLKLGPGSSLTRHADEALLAGGPAGEPVSILDAEGRIGDNHTLPMGDPRLHGWVVDALNTPGSLWTLMHAFTGHYTSPAPNAVVGSPILLRATVTSSRPIHHVNMTA